MFERIGFTQGFTPEPLQLPHWNLTFEPSVFVNADEGRRYFHFHNTPAADGEGIFNGSYDLAGRRWVWAVMYADLTTDVYGLGPTRTLPFGEHIEWPADWLACDCNQTGAEALRALLGA